MAITKSGSTDEIFSKRPIRVTGRVTESQKRQSGASGQDTATLKLHSREPAVFRYTNVSLFLRIRRSEWEVVEMLAEVYPGTEEMKFRPVENFQDTLQLHLSYSLMNLVRSVNSINLLRSNPKMDIVLSTDQTLIC